MIVRLAAARDLECVLALIRAIPELPQWSREALAATESEDQRRGGPIRRLLLAEAGGELLGFAQIAVIFGEAELESMAVQAPWRGRGVGRRLLQRAVDLARVEGAMVLRLEVRQSNLAAICLYERAGLQRIGLRRGYYAAPVEDALVLQRSWNDG